MILFIWDGVIRAWKGEEKPTMIASLSQYLQRLCNLLNKVLSRSLQVCTGLYSTKDAIVREIAVPSSSHAWHGKSSGGKW